MPKRKQIIPKESIEKLLKEGYSLKEMAVLFERGVKFLRECIKLHQIEYKRGMPLRIRKVISEKRKKWLKENPEKHPWRRDSRFKSAPCEKLKEWLKEKNIPFAEEYQALLHKKRYYSIDIAFPDKMIGIEVNGNQHYNQDGSLKEYYQNRQDHLEKAGWKIHQFHYSLCFKIEKISSLLLLINEESKKCDFNYDLYQKEKAFQVIIFNEGEENNDNQMLLDLKWDFRIAKKKLHKIYTCPDCDSLINRQATRCMKCCRVPFAKTTKIDLEQLKIELWQIPVSKLSEKYKISDTSLSKLCQRNGISKPPCGYWLKRSLGYSHEQSLLSQKKERGPAKIVTEKIALEVVHLRDKEDLGWRDIAEKLGFDCRSVARAYYKTTSGIVKG